MTEQRRVPWGPKPERPPGPIMQNVRIGDRLGVRYTGTGARFDILAELAKGKKLGAPTFLGIYYKAVMPHQTVFMHIRPNGLRETLTQSQGELHLRRDMAPSEVIIFNDPQAVVSHQEFIVIPAFDSTPKHVIDMLSASTLDEEMFQARYSDLDPGEPDIWEIDTR